MDMALLFAYFNPACSRRLLMNALYTINHYKAKGLPVFVLELIYPNREPEIYDAFHMNGTSYMFHKENLFRILEKYIPAEYTKLACIDTDIIFSNDNWYHKASQLLDTFEVVHPYEIAVWLDITYTEIIQRQQTMLLMSPNGNVDEYHPGFAWCIQRDWYNSIGFFDWSIAGCGDKMSVLAWLKYDISKDSPLLHPFIREEYERYCNNKKPSITYIKGITAKHLYHGSNKNRQYKTRYRMVNTYKKMKDLVYVNEEGLIEWVNPTKMNPVFLEYFKNRQDDSI